MILVDAALAVLTYAKREPSQPGLDARDRSHAATRRRSLGGTALCREAGRNAPCAPAVAPPRMDQHDTEVAFVLIDVMRAPSGNARLPQCQKYSRGVNRSLHVRGGGRGDGRECAGLQYLL
eukprot:scaffold26968_cov132-Isochrysis_galbana.AAC.3